MPYKRSALDALRIFDELKQADLLSLPWTPQTPAAYLDVPGDDQLTVERSASSFAVPAPVLSEPADNSTLKPNDDDATQFTLDKSISNSAVDYAISKTHTGLPEASAYRFDVTSSESDELDSIFIELAGFSDGRLQRHCTTIFLESRVGSECSHASYE